jgi:lipid-A-disaccharide synthase
MRIGLVAGEASGDQLGAGLIRALKARNPALQFEGVAGRAMQQMGCAAWEDAEVLAVMGLIEPLREIPRLLKLRRMLIERWTRNPPAVFVGIDAPDFNLGLEIALKKVGIPTVQYVSPSVWAWRQGRVRKIARAVDRVLCLLPFEQAFYHRHGIAADFVGHPLADSIPVGLSREHARRQLNIRSTQVVAVLPGSRKSEVTRLGPVFAAASRLLLGKLPDLAFVAPMANEALGSMFRSQLEEGGVAGHYCLLERNAQTAMAASDVVLLASGTAALEAALLARPIVAAYRLAPLTYALARSLRLVKVRHFTLPNLLTPDPLVPEFLQGDATAQALSDSVFGLLRDPERRADIEREFAKLRDQLARGADQRAAKAVLELAGAGGAAGVSGSNGGFPDGRSAP